MGIKFDGGAEWTPEDFDRFVERMATSLGYHPDQMLSPGFRMWYEDEEPLSPLFQVSDGGEPWSLSAKDCRAMHDRLRAVVAGWPEGDVDAAKAELLADAMEAAARADAPLWWR